MNSLEDNLEDDSVSIKINSTIFKLSRRQLSLSTMLTAAFDNDQNPEVLDLFKESEPRISQYERTFHLIHTYMVQHNGIDVTKNLPANYPYFDSNVNEDSNNIKNIDNINIWDAYFFSSIYRFDESLIFYMMALADFLGMIHLLEKSADFVRLTISAKKKIHEEIQLSSSKSVSAGNTMFTRRNKSLEETKTFAQSIITNHIINQTI